MEGLLPKHHAADAVEIPGARPLLEHLIERSAPWTIVTSGTVPLVTGVCHCSLFPLPFHHPSIPMSPTPSTPYFPFPTKTNITPRTNPRQKGEKKTTNLPQWLSVLSLPIPDHLVTAESVLHGKPDPSCYLLGRERLGLAAPEKRVLVLEDSPAGIRAGKAAGCSVLAVVTSHTAEQVLEAGPDWVVRDLASVRVVVGEGEGVRLEVRDGLVVGGL